VGIVLTPLAAVISLIVSVQHKWQPRVLAVLWCVVIISAAAMLPSLDAAGRSLAFLITAAR